MMRDTLASTPSTGQSSVSTSSTPVLSTRSSKRSMSSVSPPRKKVKAIKDAAVFIEADVLGECRYAPDEPQDAVLAANHRRFELYPMGRIADYPRHIPYYSDKTSFFEKTHRAHFNVFQYTFKPPTRETRFIILWDYNIGLVKVTPLFKSRGFSKTTPSTVIAKNPGLSELCHNITGGSLVAQGYWWPYEAAKAVALTFCWEIRYALTPIFGRDFPDQCIKPGDDGYEDMIVDPAIIRQCVEQARRYRELEGHVATQLGPPFHSPPVPSTDTGRRLRPRGPGRREPRAPKQVRESTPSVSPSNGSHSVPRLAPHVQPQLSALQEELKEETILPSQDHQPSLISVQNEARSNIPSSAVSRKARTTKSYPTRVTPDTPEYSEAHSAILEPQDYVARTANQRHRLGSATSHWSATGAYTQASEYLSEDERGAYLLMYLRFH